MEKTFDMRAHLDFDNDGKNNFRYHTAAAFESEEKLHQLVNEIAEINTPPTVTARRDKLKNEYKCKADQAYKTLSRLFLLTDILISVATCMIMCLFVNSAFWADIITTSPILVLIGVVIWRIRSGDHKSDIIAWAFWVTLLYSGISIFIGLMCRQEVMGSIAMSGTNLITSAAWNLIAILLLFVPSRICKMHLLAYEKDAEYQKRLQDATRKDEAEEARLLKKRQQWQEANKHRLDNLYEEYLKTSSVASFYKPLRDAWEKARAEFGNGKSPLYKQIFENALKNNFENGKSRKMQTALGEISYHWTTHLGNEARDNCSRHFTAPDTASGFIEKIMNYIYDWIKTIAKEKGVNI